MFILKLLSPLLSSFIFLLLLNQYKLCNHHLSHIMWYLFVQKYVQIFNFFQFFFTSHKSFYFFISSGAYLLFANCYLYIVVLFLVLHSLLLHLLTFRVIRIACVFTFDWIALKCQTFWSYQIVHIKIYLFCM